LHPQGRIARLLVPQHAAGVAIIMNDYQKFIQLLYQACFASEAMDHFDLTSEPVHIATQHWLLHDQHTAALALIEHVRARSDAIIATMIDTMGEPPKEMSARPETLLGGADLVAARFAFLSRYALEIEQAARERDGKPRLQTALHAAHGRSLHNFRLLANGGQCGCFHCLKTFEASKIVQWVDDGRTALCPHCSIDAVISEYADPIHPEFLTKMYAFWFKRTKGGFRV
jgi:hypothetical protein